MARNFSLLKPSRENVLDDCKINVENFIMQNTVWNKDKYDTLNEPYDYYSLMHYATMFDCSKNGKPIFRPKVEGIDVNKIGNGLFIQELSPLDIRGIKKVYKCPL